MCGLTHRALGTCYVLVVPIADIQHLLRDFAAERKWEQFHTLENLVMALAGDDWRAYRDLPLADS